MAELKPIHKHDCNECHFLGSMAYGTEEELDLYLCPVGILGHSLISRYGNKVSAYTSFPRKELEDSPADQLWPGATMGLPVALLLVRQMELIDKVCPDCNNNERVEEQGASGKFWWHCYKCGRNFEKGTP